MPIWEGVAETTSFPGTRGKEGKGGQLSFHQDGILSHPRRHLNTWDLETLVMSSTQAVLLSSKTNR